MESDEDGFFIKKAKQINILNKSKTNRYELDEYMTTEDDMEDDDD